MKGIAVIFWLILVMVQLLMAKPGEAIACKQVHSHLRPCLHYLRGQGRNPLAACCSGLSVLNKMINQAKPRDRQIACECIKMAASRAKFKPDKAGQLPGQCGVKISVPISPTIDCREIT
ncbi:Non-specific lipid-transfer protein 11 [Abeliophyllum distichum]|uniref:Non-specific lipid-transfer protein n=1 Tax=Abeliophyllum distichum TaxID=126358 RepID=A0ABD1SJT9_9LAMI